MTFEEYSKLILPLAKYPNVGNNFIYPLLGLAGEAGEAAEKGKKLWRDHHIMGQRDCGHRLTDEILTASVLRTAALKELGDVLWYIAAAANELGSSLEEVARMNADKLLDRNARGVISGSGDNR